MARLGVRVTAPINFGQLASLGEAIVPGDVIGSGTMGGGSALELDRRLQPGDVVEIIVDGVGTLRNRMGQPISGLWWPEERKPFM